METGPEVNVSKTKYLAMSRDQNAGRHNIKTDNSSFEWVEEFKYLWKTIQNSIQEEF